MYTHIHIENSPAFSTYKHITAIYTYPHKLVHVFSLFVYRHAYTYKEIYTQDKNLHACLCVCLHVRVHVFMDTFTRAHNNTFT